MAKKKIFISWSGEASQKVAEALREWIPSVIQAVNPWVSSQDIKAGSRWSDKIKSELDETRFGIICLTRDNLQSDWVHFEAGALAKSMKGDSEVCPYLFQVKKSQVTGPLSQFQMVEANKEETLKLLDSLNESLGEERLGESNLKKIFDRMWGELEIELNKIQTEGGKNLPTRSEKDLLEEILELVRGMSRSQTKDRDKLYVTGLYDKALENVIKHKIANDIMLDQSGNLFIAEIKKSDTDTEKGSCAPAP